MLTFDSGNISMLRLSQGGSAIINIDRDGTSIGYLELDEDGLSLCLNSNDGICAVEVSSTVPEDLKLLWQAATEEWPEDWDQTGEVPSAFDDLCLTVDGLDEDEPEFVAELEVFITELQ